MPDFHDYIDSLIRGQYHEIENLYCAERESFTFPTAKEQWAPRRDYDIERLQIDWHMDLEREHVDAISKLAIRSIVPQLTTVMVHAVELEIQSIQDSQGEELDWYSKTDEQQLLIYLNRPLQIGEQEELTFVYVIDHPRAGLHFTKACPEFPNVETSAWTQMQDDYCRYVIPIYDNPSHRFPFEAIITVPQGYYVVSNGRLVKRERHDEDHTETFHWSQEKPLPAYLITVAVSEYVEYIDDIDDLPVRYYVHKKWDRDTVYRSFGKTPRMIKFFESRLGVKYPWDKYAQVTAANFIMGGMENTSATTQTDATLHDEKTHRDFDSDPLVAHELAHMWGGDLVTCRTWTHGWLNEGWATQMENEWRLYDRGYDEYLYEQFGKQMSYFYEDKNKYRRPIVFNLWERGGDMFDRHLYPGGAWRLYMLKHLLGEDRWWNILGEWLRRYAHRAVYTHDLESLLTEMTGEDYGWFFEQWIYKAGYPECKINCSYEEKQGYVHVRVEQTQNSDDGMTPAVFKFPLTVEIVNKDLQRTRYTMQINERVHNFYYPVKESPTQIIIDPDYTVLMDCTIEKPEPMWIEQLQHGTNVIQRIRAAMALEKKPTPKAIEALGKALVEDSFWGAQAEIAKVLGAMKSEGALTQLLRGAELIKNTKALTAVARALGQFYKNDRALEALKKLLQCKDSDFVVAAAAASIGKTGHERAFEILQEGLKNAPESWHNIVRQGYLEGIAATEREEAIPVIREYMRVGTDDYLRRTVPGALARLGKKHKKKYPEILSDITTLLNDRSYRVQLAAILAAKEYGDSTIISDLERIAESSVESTVVRYAREAIRELGKKREERELDSVRKAVEELERENRELKERLARLEAVLKDKK